MNRNTFIALAVLSSLSAPARADDTDSISDYLVNVGAGHVAANELIGLNGSAVSNLQTPKDLVAALSGFGDSSSKNGFGVAWSPGRSSMKLMAVSAADYQTSELKRIWASTTFSYAQSSRTINGNDYSQRAAAVNVVYYPGNDDPVLTQYRALSDPKSGACSKQVQAFDQAARDLHATKVTLMEARKKELGLSPTQALPGAEMVAIDKALKQQADDTDKRLPELRKNPLARVRQARTDQNDPDKPAAARDSLKAGLKELEACARQAGETAASKWNATHFDLVLGQGWIRSEATGSPRISLGRHVGLAFAWGVNDGLINLTYRRISGEVDLDTLTQALAYKGKSLVAARYTYRMDDKPGKQTYALAEVSNAKASSGTTSNAAFKWAFGFDRQVGENMWIELRAGRARVPGGSAEENKALLNLKFSPEAGLLNAIKSSGS